MSKSDKFLEAVELIARNLTGRNSLKVVRPDSTNLVAHRTIGEGGGYGESLEIYLKDDHDWTYTLALSKGNMQTGTFPKVTFSNESK